MSHDSPKSSRTLIESAAGFGAGFASTLVAHPLDLLKTRLQSEFRGSWRFGNTFRAVGQIFNEKGKISSFYRGLTPNVVGNSVSWAVYFICYERVKSELRSHYKHDAGLDFYDYFFASATAGILTTLCTNPIWVIKTRMLSTSSQYPGAYTSMADGMQRIFQADGLRGFYRGLMPALLGVSHGALQFMAYETLKKRRQAAVSSEKLSATDYVVLSGLSKVFAGTLTYPFQLIRTRLQLYQAPTLYGGTSDVVKKVWKMEGPLGFYKGLGPSLLRVMPSTWVTFVVYEKTRLYLQDVEGRDAKA